MGDAMPDIRKEFVDIVSSHMDSPDEFIEATSYALMSKTVGRYYELEQIPGMKPNTYILLSSPPRVTRRGELAKCLKIVSNTAYTLLHNSLPDGDAETEIIANMLDGGSPEGLIDDIKKKI
jgi:hypothetical protein